MSSIQKVYTTSELKQFIQEAVHNAVRQFVEIPKEVEGGNLLSQQEVARRFKVTTQTLRNWEKSGLIKPVRIHRSVYFTVESINKLIKSRQS